MRKAKAKAKVHTAASKREETTWRTLPKRKAKAKAMTEHASRRLVLEAPDSSLLGMC
jgi:hypothetical protein